MRPRLGESRVAVQVAESETSPALVTAERRPLPRAAGQRGFVATLKLGVLPPGEYVARAVVTVPGQPDAHVTRSFRLAPVAAADRRLADRRARRRRRSAGAAADVADRRAGGAVLRRRGAEARGRAWRSSTICCSASIPCRRQAPAIVQQAREGTFVVTPADGTQPAGDEPTLAFIRGLAQLQKKQYAQAAAWFQIVAEGRLGFSRRRVLPRRRARRQRSRQRCRRRVADVAASNGGNSGVSDARGRDCCAWATRRRRST